MEAKPNHVPIGLHRARRAASSALVAFAVALVSGTGSAEKRPQTPKNVVEFIVKTDEKGGHVLCGLFREGGWLEDAVLAAKSAVRHRRATCVFAGVKPGVYGISAFHDENDNGELDKNFLGIPTEDWCTSRNAPARFGPPAFDDAKFAYRGGTLSLRARM